MQNSQFVAERIKTCIKERNKSLKGTLNDLHMGINTISELSKGKEISYVKMYEFAEYLGCSVDYLLGRTNNSQSHQTVSSLSDEEIKLLSYFNNFNNDGKEEALKRLDEMSALNRYKKHSEVPEEIS